MKGFLFVAALLFTLPVFSQTFSDSLYTHPQQLPEYPGGDGELIKKIQSAATGNCKEDEDFGGKIVLQFIVDTTGEILKPEIIGGRGICDEIDLNIMRVIKTLHFAPGRQDGKPVKTIYRLPIYIRLH
ncbi:MAG: energy transducer TonB [Chitinophagales bacterium]